MNRSKKVTIIMILTLLVSIGLLCALRITYSYLTLPEIKGKGQKEIGVANFEIKLNESSSLSQTIDLKETITSNNEYVVPGAIGDIELELDFTNVEVDTDYIIEVGEYNLPNNLKLYLDEDYKEEFETINETYLISNRETIYTYNIYWKWEYKTDEESNKNDSLYMNKEILLPINIIASQKIDGGN